MKHVIISYIHGRDFWRRVDFDDYPKAVFLGDKVDSFNRSDPTTLENIKAINPIK